MALLKPTWWAKATSTLIERGKDSLPQEAGRLEGACLVCTARIRKIPFRRVTDIYHCIQFDFSVDIAAYWPFGWLGSDFISNRDRLLSGCCPWRVGSSPDSTSKSLKYSTAMRQAVESASSSFRWTMCKVGGLGAEWHPVTSFWVADVDVIGWRCKYLTPGGAIPGLNIAWGGPAQPHEFTEIGTRRAVLAISGDVVSEG